MTSNTQYNIQGKYPSTQGIVGSNTTIGSVSIDQHRNNIQQRIANLQAKILKKTSGQVTQARDFNNIYGQNYKDRVMQKYNIQNNFYQYPQKQLKSQTINSQSTSLKYTYARYDTRPSSNVQPYPKLIQNRYAFSSDTINQTINNPSPYRSNEQIDQLALRQKRTSNKNLDRLTSNSINNLKNKNVDLNRKCSKRSTSKSPRSINDRSNNRGFSTKAYESSKYHQRQTNNQNIDERNISKSGISVSSQIKRQNSHSNHHNNNPSKKQAPLKQYKQSFHNYGKLQSDFQNLNKTISNLRQYSQQIKPSSSIRQNDLSSSYLNLNNTIGMSSSVNANHQLYQMMRSILMGQQKLEKQLQEIKNKQKRLESSRNNITSHTKNNISDRVVQKKSQFKQANKGMKTVNISPKMFNEQRSKSRSRSRSARKFKQTLNNSPIPAFDRQQSYKKGQNEDKTNKKVQIKQNNPVKRGRISSTNTNIVRNKGKILKNKTKFDQLYQLALKAKKLNSQNQRIILQPSRISQVWNKIHKVISRTTKQNLQTSTIHHQNNKYMNDHIINTIQLQKKLQNDLVKKVYQMCQNKCVYK